MAVEDVLAELLAGVPVVKPKSDETIVRDVAGDAVKLCACGDVFTPRGKEERCGRCLDGMA